MKALPRQERENIERWQRAEGKAVPPKRMGPPLGHTNAMKHGIFANKCLDEEERVLFQEVIERLYQDFEFNRSSDYIQLEFIAINTVKYMRAIAEGNLDAAQKLDGMIRAHLKDLKTTKLAREGDQPTGPQTTPADWAADLLRKSDEQAESQKPRKTGSAKKPNKIGDNTESGNDEDAENSGDYETEEDPE